MSGFGTAAGPPDPPGRGGGASGDEPDAPPSVPVCTRHPDRETYIRCSRCQRPICPECMTPASVGFHCPDCVAAGRRTVRSGTTVLGGTVHRNPTLVTRVLIGLNAAVFLGTLALGNAFTEQLLLVRLGLLTDGDVGGVLTGEWYRLLTATFLHNEIWHVGLNMLALWVLGSALEPVLGRWRFLSLYLVAGLGGSTASVIFSQTASLGASGAVFGLLGALVVVMRRLDRDVGGVLVILGLNVVLGFVVGGIDWRAHLGGLAVGLVIGWIFANAPRRHRMRVGVLGVVGVLLALVVVLVVWSQTVI